MSPTRIRNIEVPFLNVEDTGRDISFRFTEYNYALYSIYQPTNPASIANKS